MIAACDECVYLFTVDVAIGCEARVWGTATLVSGVCGGPIAGRVLVLQ